MCKHPLAFLGLKTVAERRQEEATRVHREAFRLATLCFTHRVQQDDETSFYVELRHPNNSNWRSVDSQGNPRGPSMRKNFKTFEEARDHGIKAEALLREVVRVEFVRRREFMNTYTPPGYEREPINGNISDEALFIEAVTLIWTRMS